MICGRYLGVQFCVLSGQHRQDFRQVRCGDGGAHGAGIGLDEARAYDGLWVGTWEAGDDVESSKADEGYGDPSSGGV